MTLTTTPRRPRTPDPEALIAEARRRQRRQRLALAAALLLAVAAGALAYVLTRGASVPAVTGREPASALRTSGGIRLERPGPLAVGPNGTLYIADSGRNQIVERLPNGRLQVLAGTGKAGFSGDGGPARRAELDDPAGMTIAEDGSLYFADQANNRVRAISPEGTIRTVAGNGRGGWVKAGTRALAAPILSPAAVTFDARGRLTIADSGWSEVVRLERDGRLTRLAGVRRYAGVYGIGRPATQASTDGPDALAYDRAGDLYLAGFNTKTLLMITPTGWMTLIGADYPYAGGMITTPDGRVLVTNRAAILELTPHGTNTYLDFLRHRLAGIAGFDAQGIAADTEGNLYLDTWPGGYTNNRVTAVVELHPNGTTRILWRSP